MGPTIMGHGIHSDNFVEQIMSEPEFQLTLSSLAAESGRTDRDVNEEARANLKELAAEQNPVAIEAWDKLCRWLGRAYKLDVDHKALEKLRELNRTSSLVFLPNHRSYLDPLILRSALEKHDFPPNHTLGGVNLAFWPLGAIGRRTGLVFIRREFKDAPVYRACLREYLAYMVRKQDNMEWYIEGGRTRTGKLRPPRMGILSYLVDAFKHDAEEDVLLVPVFVGYDQQYEVDAISAEEQGGTKDPESAKWLVKFARAQTVRRGRAHLRFGEPLSLREALAESRASDDERDARLAVPKIAFEVCHRINKVTPIMPSALLLFPMLDNEGRALTAPQGRVILEPLVRYIRRRGLDLSEDMDLVDHGALYDTLKTLVREGVVTRYDGGLEPVFGLAEGRQHEAAFYRNTLIHYFITRAMVEVALVRAAEVGATDTIDEIWEEAVRLRDVLKYEFFFPRLGEFADDISNEAEIAFPGWEDHSFDSEQLLPLMRTSRLHLAHRVIGPFLEAYGVLADRLSAHALDKKIDRDKLIAECIGVAQQRWLQRELHSPESISKDLFTNAFRLADNRGLIHRTGAENLQEQRDAFANEFHDAIRRVDIIRHMAIDTENEVAAAKYAALESEERQD